MSLKERVEQYYNSQTFIASKGAWYACRVFVADMSPQVPSRLLRDNDLICIRYCWTKDGVDRFIDRMQDFFAEPNLRQLKDVVYSDNQVPGPQRNPMDIRSLPNDWANNTDMYLKRGDIIMSDFVGGLLDHVGVYIGHGKVAHMSGHKQGKLAAKCRIGNLVGNFVDKETDSLRLGLIRVQIRPHEFIAMEAERMANDNFRDGEYNLLLKNCQHFAMLCATGSDSEYMKMGLIDRVNQYWNAQTFIGKKVKVVTGRSSADQEYAILVTSGLWYACRVFVADMSPHIRSRRPSGNDLIINTDCFTMNGVNEFINEMKAFFAKPNLTLKNYLLPPIPGCLEIREVPSDWGNNPDKYIQRGDIILSDFVAGSSHAGIYIGNAKVAHMSGHGQGKAAGKCRIGDLVGDFVHNKTDALRLGLIRVQIRPREFLATEAERMASDNHQDGEYNLLLKNCQHFAMLCATGSECLTDLGGRSWLEAARIDFPR